MEKHTPSFALAIVGLAFLLPFPIVTYPCSIIALVLGVRKRYEYNTTAAIVMGAIGLFLALVNTVMGMVVSPVFF